MKIKLLYVLALVLLAACSVPKYTYNFDYYNYNAGKNKSQIVKEVATTVTTPDVMAANELVASAGNAPVIFKKQEATIEVKKTYVQMTKSERKDLRKELKSKVKAYVKEKREVEHANAIGDADLKLAAIFGAVGIVGLIIGGQVFYIIGAIALIIGVVFFVKWLMRQ
jgi:hypothetical protein